MTRSGLDRDANADCRPALKFHSIHGQNIQREEGGCRVVRRTSFCNGIVFSNRPISIDERVGIRQTTLSTNWSGVLRFGVTTIDPALHRSLELPRFACPFLSERPGYWIRALPDRYAKQGSLVQFFVTRAGDVIYGVNGASKGIFLRGVDTSRALWVVVDVYGTAKAVEFESSRRTPPRDLRDVHMAEPAVQSIERRFASGVRVQSPPPPPLSLPTRQPPRRDGFTFFGFSLRGGGGDERRPQASATAGRTRMDTAQPPSPRVVASGTPVARPRPPPFVPSPPRQERASARIDWGIGSSRSEVRPPVRTTSLVRQTPSSTRSPTSSTRMETMQTPSTTRALAAPVVRPSPTSSASRGGADDSDEGAIYRRIGQFSETTMRLVRDWTDAVMESAVAPLSPRRAVQPTATQTTSSSTTAGRSPPTASSAVRRTTTTATTPSDGYLRLQPSSASTARRSPPTASSPASTPTSSSRRQNQTTSSGRVLRVAVTAQAQTTSATRSEDAARRRRSPLAAATAQNATASPSAARNAATAQKQKPTPASKEDHSSDCSICMEAAVNAVIYTCGHMCMCYECALKIKVNSGICPLCRQPIKDVIRTFKS